MTQSTQRSNLLGGTNLYQNPRYEAEAADLEAHDKALVDQKATGDDNATKEEPKAINWEKRYKDLQSYNSRKINELTQERDEARTQPVKPVIVPKTAEELAALKQQDPEGYARIEAIASTMVEGQMSKYNQQLAAINGDLEETKIANAQLEIRKAHSDFDQIINDDRFHSWAEAQDKVTQDWIYNNPDNPALAIKALSLFKFESGWGNTNTNDGTGTSGGDLDVGVRTNSQAPEAVDRNHPTYIWKESEIAKMRSDEFGKWEEHITLAQREGRIAIGQ